jgi:chaperonin cofactor prefoldin
MTEQCQTLRIHLNERDQSFSLVKLQYEKSIDDLRKRSPMINVQIQTVEQISFDIRTRIVKNISSRIILLMRTTTRTMSTNVNN